MAFLRYVISASAGDNATTVNNVFSDIKNWIDGTTTATSGFSSTYCNTGASEIVGTIPSSIYDDCVKNTNTSSTNDSYISVRKYHNEWSTYSSSTHPSNYFTLYWSISGTYGIRMRIGNASQSNYMPYPSTNYYHAGNTNDNYKQDYTPSNTTIFMWLEEDFMAVQVVHSQAPNSDSIFIGAFDLPRSEYAEYAYSEDSDFGNMWTFSSSMKNTHNNSAVPTYDWIYAGSNDYVDDQGVNQSYPANYNQGYGDGFSSIDSYAVHTIYPTPWRMMPQVNIATGVGHQLVPCFSAGGGGEAGTGYFPITARIKGLYRTSDNFADTGTAISYGGNNYRVALIHKCGSSMTDADNTLNACYLLPVTG
jgi:hypothetical protein